MHAKRQWPRKAAKWAIGGILLGAVILAVLWAAFPFPRAKLEAWRRDEPAALVLDRNGAVLCAFVGNDSAARPGSLMFWAGIDDINPQLGLAVIAVEDKRFHNHIGVDPIAAARAACSNLVNRRIVSGASTITMQTVRLMQPRPRTAVSKIVEAFRAIQLERLLGKDEILEYYLNQAPFGGNLVGAEAASLCYFGKHARDLTLAESALLAGLPQSPTRYRPDRHPDRARVRRDHVLDRMHACGFISPEELARAKAEPVSVRRHRLPFIAPHFSQLVSRLNPGEKTLRTTLDRRLQRLCEAALRDACDRLRPPGELRPAGVPNGSIVIVENSTAAVRAMAGSCDFFSLEDAGQVNGAIARRSPGSALKPFTYALAFDRGICSPGTILADVSVNYAGYAPQNYDRGFRGPVSAREALTASLNVPAVRLLEQVGHARLYQLLGELGITTLTMDADHYGLGLTLGSADVRLLELANAYATLARFGEHRPLRFLENDRRAPARRVLSPEAAYLVLDVLSDHQIPGTGALAGNDNVRIAWKTGTSWGHRDAWTIACTPEFTVGVWLGNFSGKPDRGLIGVKAAAPVAADLIGRAKLVARLHGDGSPAWFARPDGVEVREVCSLSGMPPNEHCPAVSRELFIRGRSPVERCTVHQHLDAGDIVEVWPAEIDAWLRENASGRHLPPEGGSSPSHMQAGGAIAPPAHVTARLQRPPRILSPAAGQTLVVLDAGRSSASQDLTLKAASAARRLHWFVDGAFHATASPGQQVFWPIERGAHTIVCCDDSGSSSTVTIHVQ